MNPADATWTDVALVCLGVWSLVTSAELMLRWWRK